MKNIKKLGLIFTLFIFTGILVTGCGKEKSATGTIKVAATSVPHAEILEHIKPILEEDGVILDLTVIDDYNIPNRALSEKEVDANFFQHSPFLESEISEFGYDIQEFAKIHIEPLGIYSKKFASIDDIPEGATISIPNDNTNEGRALALLHHQGLIKIDDLNKPNLTILDIAENPKNIKFQEIDAAMLPRTLDDVDASVINTNFALTANLNPTDDALAIEDANSPYANVLAIRNGDESNPDLIKLKEVLTSDAVREFISSKYEGAIVPVF